MNRKIHKRNKKILKVLKKIGFRNPHKVVVDDVFVTAINKSMLGLQHINDLFKSQPKLLMTKCIYGKYGKERKTKNNLLKYVEILDCKHVETKTPLECLSGVMRKSNRNHYILGSNCPETTDTIGKHRGIPTLACRNGCLMLYADIESIPANTNFKTEADEEELNRLELLFGGNDASE